MLCKVCGKEYYEDYRKCKYKVISEYCSQHCAHSRKFSDETNIKRSESNKKAFTEEFRLAASIRMKNRWEHDREKIIASTTGICHTKNKEKQDAKNKEKRLQKFLDFQKSGAQGSLVGIMGPSSFRKCLFEILGNKCSICGITEWQGTKISLHVHHVDGKSTNNLLSNLQILCPNCHSQTPTFGSKNYNKSTREFKFGF